MLKTFFDYCSGIGGGRLGLEQCGLTCVGHSETSRLAETTYNLMHNTINDKNYGNLKKLSGDKLPQYDVLIAGFPCQAFSIIGKKDGFNDTRGQIIFHLSRLLQETKPKCFILENVKGLVTHDKGKTLEVILNELDKSGYNTIYKVIASLDCGIPQMRQRIYFIGVDKSLNIDIHNYHWPDTITCPPISSFLIDTNNEINEINYGYFMKYLINPTNISRNYSLQDFFKEEYLILDTRMNDMRLYRNKMPTLRAQRDGIYYIRDHKLRNLTGYEALLLQGFPIEYASKVRDKVSNRHLLMQAGNAMTVNVIQLLGKSLINLFNKEVYHMSEQWQSFESECYLYLKNKYGKYAAFTAYGQSDSTIPDILTTVSNRKSFYIETKSPNAQSGQFVLLANKSHQTFDYSPRNSTPFLPATKIIIDYMNDNFSNFVSAGTKGTRIDLDPDIFYSWIKDYYSSKGVRYFITKGNDYLIFPIEQFNNYFDVTATYRIKKSGSSIPGKSNIAEIQTILQNHHIHGTIFNIGKKMYLKTDSNIGRQKLSGNKYTYLFKEDVDSNFLIRKLSNTNNANVIFQITLKKYVQDPTDLDDFLKNIS